MRGRPDVDVLYSDAIIFGETSASGKTMMELSPSSGEVTFSIEAIVFGGSCVDA